MRALGLLVLALLVVRSAAQQEDEDHTKEAPTAEGSLDNDVFVPIADASAQALGRADALLVRARAAHGAEGERQLDAACEEWRSALVAGGAGTSVWFDPALSAHRLAEGLTAALWRRLEGLSGPERARWSARFAEGSQLALVAAGERADELAEVLRLFPGTAGSARAALRLADQALEAGLRDAARAWIARAEAEAEFALDAAARNACATRRAALGSPATSGAEAWTRAAGCALVGSLGWKEPAGRTGERARNGAAFSAPDELAVQTAAGEVLLLGPGKGTELALGARIALGELLEGYSVDLQFDAPREAPGWPLLPLAEENGLVLVAGRTSQGEPNALLALELAPRTAPGLGLDLAPKPAPVRLRWALVGSERVTTAGTTSPVPALEELGEFEFQPGPVLCGDQIVVQLREYAGQVRAWLIALDRRDGALLWRRQLAAGADLVATTRLAPSTKRLAAQPLCAVDVGGRACVFAGTHLGLGVLLDATLGEPLWSLKNRRRAAHDRGWDGDRPVLACAPDAPATLLWDPADSDHLYALRAAPAAAESATAVRGEEAAVLVRPPAPVMDAESLVAGDGNELLVLGGLGKEHAVSLRRAGRDRVDALELDSDERFSGRALASQERVWVPTNHALYLLDRERELYLLERVAFPRAGGDPPGGDVYARGEHVVVVGKNAVWWFRAR